MTFCSYADCLTPKANFSRRTFFALPMDQRRRSWILNSGNPELLNIKPTSKRYFCDLHFRPCDIRAQFNRSTLHRAAIILPHKSVAENVDETEETRPDSSTDTETQQNNREVVIIDEESASRISVPDDLIFTDFEGSSHLNSNCDSPSDIEVILEDDDHLMNTSNASTTNDILQLEVIDEPANNLSVPLSPAKQSSFLSNVFIRDAMSVKDEDPNPKPPTISIDSSTSSPYPTRRALLRRRIRTKPLLIRRKRKTHRKTKLPSHEPVKQSAPTALISLEDVAGRTEDTYFALSLVGSLERLSARKRATAKLYILQYLTELAFAED